jgi:hypothetical protein
MELGHSVPDDLIPVTTLIGSVATGMAIWAALISLLVW